MTKLRQWLKNRKTYIVVGAGLLTALAAWSAGGMTTLQFVSAVFAAIGGACLRAGIGKKES